jgi:hypothetical protein
MAGSMLMGPVSGLRTAGTLFKQDVELADSMQIDLPLPERLVARIGGPAVYLFLAFALFLVWRSLRTPYDKVTLPPGRWHLLLELLFPGTARAWRVWGGLILSLAIWGIIEVVTRNINLRYIFSFGFDFGRSGNAFGLPPIAVKAFNDLKWPADPGWLWTAGPAFLVVLIFVVNAALVLRSRPRMIPD